MKDEQREGQPRLEHTVAALRPRLLVLDPFVRLHRCDENASSDVAPLLDRLRELQRQHQLAVLVVHHARKGGATVRAGQALRGSSEFHAWGDSLLYLRRNGDRLTLSVEHRAAPGIDAIALRLATAAGAPTLEIVTDSPAPVAAAASSSPLDRIRQVLAEAPEPLAFAALRSACAVRKATLYELVDDLVRRGEIVRGDSGYRLAHKT